MANTEIVESDNVHIEIYHNAANDQLVISKDGKTIMMLHLNRYNVNHMISCLGTIIVDACQHDRESDINNY